MVESVLPIIPVSRSIETQSSIKKLLDKKASNRKRIVDKKKQTVESELIEPNEINRLKVRMPFKSSHLKDKATNTDYSCFDIKVNDPQNESELSTSDEYIADNDISQFHISQCSDNDTHTHNII